MSEKLTIKELRKSTGLSQSKFAAKFQFKLRTLQHWECDNRNTPVHILHMVKRILELESELAEKS